MVPYEHLKLLDEMVHNTLFNLDPRASVTRQNFFQSGVGRTSVFVYREPNRRTKITLSVANDPVEWGNSVPPEGTEKW